DGRAADVSAGCALRRHREVDVAACARSRHVLDEADSARSHRPRPERARDVLLPQQPRWTSDLRPASVHGVRALSTEVVRAMIVTGVRSPRSVGIERYARHLSAALHDAGVDYRCRDRVGRGSAAHFHLANSSRAAVLQAPRLAGPYVLTVHD